MNIRFTVYLDPEEWDFVRIIRAAGYAHEIDGNQVLDKVYDGGTRELPVIVELNTETGIITVVGQNA